MNNFAHLMNNTSQHVFMNISSYRISNLCYKQTFTLTLFSQELH